MISHPLFRERFLQHSREVVSEPGPSNIWTGLLTHPKHCPANNHFYPQVFFTSSFYLCHGPRNKASEALVWEECRGPGFRSLVLTDEEENETVCHARLSILGLSQPFSPCVPGRCIGSGGEGRRRGGAAERC